MLYLNIPYKEKNEAKALGARWNPNRKQWYVPNKQDYHKFSPWIINKNYLFTTVLCDHFYIVERNFQCIKCKEFTPVIAFGFENYWIFEEDLQPLYWDYGVTITAYYDFIPQKVLDFAQSKWNLRLRYSQFGNCKYVGNRCKHCNRLQGNYLLFQEYGSPFFITSIEDAEDLTLYKIKLSEDIILPNIEFGWCSTDDLVKELAPVIETNIIV